MPSTSNKKKDPHKKKKIRIIQKESALTAVYASGNLTTTQKKVFNAFLYLGKELVQSPLFAAEEGFSVPVSSLKGLIGDKSNNYTFLKKTVESLQDFTVESNALGKDKDKKWDRFSLVAGATIEEGVLRFSFPHQIIEALKTPKMYVTLDLDEINRISKKYAISLYEIIEDYKKLPTLPKWSIEEFKRALDIPEKSYTKFPDLHKRVIEPAVIEINEKFEMGLEYILYSNLLTIHSSELAGYGGSTAMSGRKRMPRITHIQFKLKKESLEKRKSYKAFVEEMRVKFMPDPNEGLFPTLAIIDDDTFKVDTKGRLYIVHETEEESDVRELSPQESDKYWKMLWKRDLEQKEQQETQKDVDGSNE